MNRTDADAITLPMSKKSDYNSNFTIL